VLAVLLVVALASCSPATSASPGRSSIASSRPAPAASSGPRRPARKVMVIAEENHTYEEVFGQGRAPYLAGLAASYATITGMDAGYPASCPSLPAYLLMTSGSTSDVCDDGPPAAHPIVGPSIFSQVTAAGLQWRGYAESMPAPCTRADAGRYLVRHAPAPYYTQAAANCPSWDVPLGGPTSGALQHDVTAASLPAYAFVTPDACDDMHGGPGCPDDLVTAGDQWLATWLPLILAGPDYRAGRLVVVVTWDEGSTSSNHIPTVVLAPTARGVRVTSPITHCGLLAMEEQVLGLPLLGCARTAASPAAALGLVR
jgi:phosphatidylinositol-3-phosphatase